MNTTSFLLERKSNSMIDLETVGTKGPRIQSIVSPHREKAKGKIKHIPVPFFDGERWKIWDPNRQRLRMMVGIELSQHLCQLRKEGIKAPGRSTFPLPSSKTKKGKTIKIPKITTTAIVKIKPEKVEPPIMIPVRLPIGMEVFLGEEGKIWYKPKAFGAEVCIPMKTEKFTHILIGNTKHQPLKAVCTKVPDTEWKVPRVELTRWAERLAQYDTEALCIYGKLRGEPTADKPLWMAVVPKQECTGATVDVDDFAPAGEVLMKEGYQRVGTIHTHPGGSGVFSGTKSTGPTCSGVDKNELWDGFGGVHIIVSKGGSVTFYFSLGGETWRLADEVWQEEPLWAILPTELGVCTSLVNETGVSQVHSINTMITKKKYTGCIVQGGYNSWMGRGKKGKKSKKDKKGKKNKIQSNIITKLQTYVFDGWVWVWNKEELELKRLHKVGESSGVTLRNEMVEGYGERNGNSPMTQITTREEPYKEEYDNKGIETYNDILLCDSLEEILTLMRERTKKEGYNLYLPYLNTMEKTLKGIHISLKVFDEVVTLLSSVSVGEIEEATSHMIDILTGIELDIWGVEGFRDKE